jgi:hypothetical protein
MPLIANRILSPSEDVSRIESLYETAVRIFHHDNDLVSDLTSLKNFGLELVSYYHEYDVHPSIQANGFRGVLDLGISLLEYGIYCFRYYDTDPPSVLLRERDFQDFKAVVHNFHHGIPYVRKMRSLTQKKGSLEMDSDLLVDFFHDYLTCDDSRKMIFTKSGNFDFGPTVAAILSASAYFRTLSKSPDWKTCFNGIVDRQFRLLATSIGYKRFSVSQLRENVDNESWLAKYFYPWMVNGVKPKIKRDLLIPRQQRLQIIFDPQNQEPKIIRIPGKIPQKEDVIKCRLLSEGQGRKVLINVHGGGYILGNLYCNDVYLRYWASKIPEINILSVEISLAPEKRYPSQIQVSIINRFSSYRLSSCHNKTRVSIQSKTFPFT